MIEVVATAEAIRRAKLQSNRHHRQINTHSVYTDRMPFLSPNQQFMSQNWREKCHIAQTCSSQAQLEVFQFYLWPLKPI